jgi:hypothetical protein
MKYEGKEITEAQSKKKHAEHIKAKDAVFATSDGNCFVGVHAKAKAHSHAVSYKPSLTVFDLTEVETEIVEKPKKKAKTKKAQD